MKLTTAALQVITQQSLLACCHTCTDTVLKKHLVYILQSVHFTLECPALTRLSSVLKLRRCNIQVSGSIHQVGVKGFLLHHPDGLD